MILRLAFVATVACFVVHGKKKSKDDEGDDSEATVSADGKVDGPVIGIDLGTTYSCVGVFKNGRVEIIPNDQGNRITPSFVAFTDDERLVGESAKNHALLEPTQTLFDVKRFIGRRFKEQSVQNDIKMFPYTIVDKGGAPVISVKVMGKPKQLAPEEVSAMVLTKMKTTAEAFLGKDVGHAVITVPAYFNDAQRTATRDAGVIAGLKVLRIINEPTAAAIAYGLDGKAGSDSNILVYDLGGGTFDVSLLSIDNGVFEVLATSGNTHLGGEDFDHRVMKHLADVFKKKHKKDLTKDKRAMQKLRREVEKAKRALSTSYQTAIDIEALHAGIDFSEPLTRAKFEDLNGDLFKSTLKPVEKVLQDASMEISDIHEIVLVGGSTRIPKVQALIKEFFDGKEPTKGVNPDEAVAYGAAVQAGILGGEESATEKQLLLLDVTPLSLGTSVKGGKMAVIIPRGTTVPTTKTDSFTTTEDYQTSIHFDVYEGERAQASKNHLLGRFGLSGLPPVKKGVPSVELTYTIDVNGILHVKAIDQATGKSKSVKITNEKGRLTEQQIEKMVRDAEKYADADDAFKSKADALVAFESYLESIEKSIEDKKGIRSKLEDDELDTIKKAISSGRDWLSKNSGGSAEKINEKKKEVQDECDPIFSKHYGKGGGGGDGDEGGDEDEDDDDHGEL